LVGAKALKTIPKEVCGPFDMCHSICLFFKQI
jgi:hypothetical protein